MTNPNLTAALLGTLDAFENQDSPLSEATPDAIDELLDRINTVFAEGLPERITDETLLKVVRIYRAQALHWEQEEQTKKTRAKRAAPAPRGPGQILDLDLLGQT